ncbi:MAG: UbiA family prenyltransferase, partial [Pseudomonadota bacterium]
LSFLEAEHAAGRRLVLATASNEKYASAIARELGIFGDVLASTDTQNLAGARKLSSVKEICSGAPFDYAGNAMVDLALWREANSALLVNPERGVRAAAEKQSRVSKVFDDHDGPAVKRYLKALRMHQWLKNLLVFVPLLTSHRFYEPLLVLQAGLAFLSFGLCASSVYLLNDLLDISDDRQHATKRNRPIAAGQVSIKLCTLQIPMLLLAAVAVASMLPPAFWGVLAVYYATTLAYSFRLKRAALVDVLTLAGLYTLRVIAGAAAVTVTPSFWLLAFSMFLFLSLAMVKRFTELLALREQNRKQTPGRGYSPLDVDTIAQFGSSSAYMAVLVLALYINSETVQDLYTHPELIWLLCPLLLYLLTRIWLMARRGEVDEDPVVFVIRDRRSQGLVLVGALLLWLAI